MFKPFKAPSNNHQGFGQGDGAEHVTVKEFVDGVNALFARVFGGDAPAAPANDDPDLLEEALGRISDLEHALTNVQMKLDALSDFITAPKLAPTGEPQPQPPAHPHPDDEKSSLDPDGKPASGLAPEPSTHTAPLEADPAGAPKVEPV